MLAWHLAIQRNSDLSSIKRFPVTWGRESATMEFRSEFFSAFNHPQFGDPDTEFTSLTFGQINSTVVNPRVVQLALKLSFRGHKPLLDDQLHLHGVSWSCPVPVIVTV